MPALEFRPAALADALTLVAFESGIAAGRLYGPLLTAEGAAREIADNVFVFIMEGGALIGTTAYRVRPNGTGYISNVAIAPQHRRRGIARAAMNLVLEARKNVRRVELVTHPENVAALALYRSFGFVVESRSENAFGDGEPRLVLARVLAD